MTLFRSLTLTILVALFVQSAIAADTPTVTVAPQAVPPAATLTVTPPLSSSIPAIPVIVEPVPVPPTASVAAPAKIGYADLLKIGSESIPGKAAEARFKAKADKFKKQINDKEKQLEKQKKAIEEKLPTMSPEERGAKAKEFEKKLDDYRKYVQKAQKEMEPLQKELSLSIYTILEGAAREYGRNKGLAAIVPKKELLFVGDSVESVDVTDDLLKLVNEREKSKK